MTGALPFATSAVDGRAGAIAGEGREEVELDEVEGAPAVEGGGGGPANELGCCPDLGPCFFLTVRGTNISVGDEEEGKEEAMVEVRVTLTK